MGTYRVWLALTIGLGLCAWTRAQAPNARDDWQFVLSGMRQERLKLHSGVCRMTGRYISRDLGNPTSNFDGSLTIFAAFEGEDKIRFDRAQPGWVLDPSTVQEVPGGKPGQVVSKTKRGVAATKFFDNGKKAGWWREDEPQINVVASLAGKPMGGIRVGYFDVRGLGLYHLFARERQERLNDLIESFGRNRPPAVGQVQGLTPLAAFSS